MTEERKPRGLSPIALFGLRVGQALRAYRQGSDEGTLFGREVIEGEPDYKSLAEELAEALTTSGATNGIAKDFLEFHGAPSKQLKNCQEMLAKHEELAEEALANYRKQIREK